MAAKKEILVLRHAKSSRNEAGLADLDRPLQPRGFTDAEFIARRNQHTLAMLDVIFTSPALRAMQTTKVVCRAANIDSSIVRTVDLLYETSPSGLLQFIKSLSNSHSRIMVVGHNPTFTGFVNLFLTEALDNLPTSGLVILQFDVERWADVGNHHLIFSSIDYPKGADYLN